MPSSNSKLLLICDDDIMISIINGVLSKISTCDSQQISNQDFTVDKSLEDTSIIVIDERKNVPVFLNINHFIKDYYPHIKLIVLTDYLENEFEGQFKKSGADYVLTLASIQTELFDICTSISKK